MYAWKLLSFQLQLHNPGNTAMKMWHDTCEILIKVQHQVHDSTDQYCTLEQRAPWKHCTLHTYALKSNPCTVQ